MVRILSQYASPKTLLLVPLEAMALVACLLGSVRLRFWNDGEMSAFYLASPDFALQTLMTVLLIQMCFFCNDLYDAKPSRSLVEELLCVGESLGAACLLIGVAFLVLPTLPMGRSVFVIFVAVSAMAMMAIRAAFDRLWPTAKIAQNILILGGGAQAATVARELATRGDLDARLAGIAVERGDEPTAHCPVLGEPADVRRIVQEREISRIIIANEEAANLPVHDLIRCRLDGVLVEDAQSALSALTGRIWLDTIRPSWLLYSEGFRLSHTTRLLKRIADLFLGITGLAISAPIMALVAVAVRITSRGPIFYRQIRVGLHGKEFSLIKFRSMRRDAESNGPQWAQDGDARVTAVGKYLRKFRLDELPQFINVIRGDMSLVGPRPERPYFVRQLREAIPYYDERHCVRPGVTGWAQVRYPYGSTVEDAYRKLEYDLFYLKNMSVFFDCAIILQTVRHVLFGRGSK